MTNQSLLENYFNDILKLFPSLASSIGYHKYDNHIENYLSKKHHYQFISLQHKYLKKLLKYNDISNIENLTLKWIIDDNINGDKFPFDLVPLSSFENDIIDFTFLNETSYEYNNDQDLLNLISRYKDFYKFIELSIEKMHEGLKKNVTLPNIICRNLINNLEKFVKNKYYIVQIPKDIIKKHRVEYMKYIKYMNKYEKLLNRLIHFLSKEYYGNCRETIGICDLPNGKEMYKYLIKSNTSLDLTPEEIHNIGLKEVDRITKKMEILKVKFGYPKSMKLTEFYDNMTVKYAFKDEKSLLKAYNKKKKEIVNNIIPEYFKKRVNDFVIAKVPKKLEQTSPAAYYYPGSYDGNRKGTFYINLRDIKENFLYEVTTLSLHECEPGHHYQYQYMHDMNIPKYKIYSYQGDGFAEGWALYAESFGNYENNLLDYFGNLTYELFRAIRLVVDTGIHWYGWTYDKAVNYMNDNLAFTLSSVESEIERYICDPGQALCYKLGEQKFKDLRDLYLSHNIGTIKDYHQLVLEDGILPLIVLEYKIKNMINMKKM